MNNKEIFKTHGFCIVRNALESNLRDAVTQYALFDEMQNFTPGSWQVPNAHSKYADPMMETILLNLQSIIEENTGLTLYPTYSYYRVYRKGDELKFHVDRPACEISATLCFNYEYTNTDYNWPIYIQDNKVVLYPGDLAIYRGCDLKHGRDEFKCNEGDWHVQGFFHYVDASGPYPEWKFDKRESIGLPAIVPDNAQLVVPTNLTNNSKPYIKYL